MPRRLKAHYNIFCLFCGSQFASTRSWQHFCCNEHRLLFWANRDPKDLTVQELERQRPTTAPLPKTKDEQTTDFLKELKSKRPRTDILDVLDHKKL